VSKRDFERKFRGRYRIKDPDYVNELYEEYGADFDNAGKNEERIEEVFDLIDARVSDYKRGRARERAERERDQKKRNEHVDEEQVPIPPPWGAYEMARAKAVSEYVAKVAPADIVTTRYRERVLGRTLTAQEAERFLSSPVAASVNTGIGLRARRRRVSFLDYEIEEQAEDDDGPYRVLRYSSAGRDLEFRLRPLLRVPGRGDSFMVYPGDTISPDEWWQPIPDQNANVLLLPMRSGDSVVAKSNSALDLLAKQANRLFRRYLLEPEDAAWLILTGENPKPKYMSARLSSVSSVYLSRAVLTLTVEPWVSPEEVTSYYRDIRQSILQDAGSKDRTVEVFRFVVAHTEVEEITMEKTPQWKRLCDLWNAEHPDDPGKRFSDYRDFRKSYIRGHDAIAFPISD
jgi:hypothetical protein